MRFRPALTVLILTLLSAASLAAQDSPLFGPAGFAFTGKWNCNGSIPAKGKTLPHHAVYEGRTVSGGKAIEIVQDDIAPAPYDATMLFGYDTTNRKVVNFVVDGTGYAVLTGPGWQGPSLTLTMTGEGSYPGFGAEKPMPISRVTYEFKSGDAFSLHWEVQRGSEWKLDDSLDCVRPDAASEQRSSLDLKSHPQAGE